MIKKGETFSITVLVPSIIRSFQYAKIVINGEILKYNGIKEASNDRIFL